MSAEAQAQEQPILKKKLNEILSQNTGKSYEEIARDTERDNWMTSQEALEYGIIDTVVTNRPKS